MRIRGRLVPGVAALVVIGVASVGCTGADRSVAPAGETPPSSTATTPSPTGETPTAGQQPRARVVRPADLRVGLAVEAVRHLAGAIGPRPATSPAYRRAVAWVAGELTRRGFDVRRQRVDVPGGVS